MFFLGWIIGLFLPIECYRFLSSLISFESYTAVILIALSVSQHLSKDSLLCGSREALLGVSEGLLNGVIAGVLFSLYSGIDIKTSLGIAFGMGWYSFAGPLIALHAGPLMGLLAFLVNMLCVSLLSIGAV